MKYPVKLQRDTNGTLLGVFPDVPEAHTFADDERTALRRAAAALETALSVYIEQRLPIPDPSPIRRGYRAVSLPALSEVKVALYRTMLDQGVRKSELARRLGWHTPQVDRLLDLTHKSRLDQIEAAFHALNKELDIAVRDAA